MLKWWNEKANENIILYGRADVGRNKKEFLEQME